MAKHPHPFRSSERCGILRSWGMFACLCLGVLLRLPAADEINLALHQPVVASGPTWGAFSPALLTDGNPATFSHPLTGSGTAGYSFEVDLGGTFTLDRIVVRNRNDGCCPERLNNYSVEVRADREGDPGEVTWSARIRADGSNSGVGGVDTVTAELDRTGAFAGRFVRLVNQSETFFSPQLAEIEVYGGTRPLVVSLTADAETFASGESTTLRWTLRDATRATIDRDVGPVDPVQGSVVVRPLTTTTYTLSAINESGTNSARITLGVDVKLAPPRITEFLASGSSGLEDADGDASDWIELENPNPYRMVLSGFYLTDDPADRRKWAFPAAIIPAAGRRVVFASGKDRRNADAELHTNFRLSADGDYLALTQGPGGTVVQQFPDDYPATKKFPVQRSGFSYGTGTNGQTGFFRPATPGFPNGPAFDGIVGNMTFSVGHGFYDSPITVVLSTATPDAVIRYTTNRAEPSESIGLIYSTPLDLARTTVIRAAAFRPGWSPTPVETQTYVFPADIIASSVMRTTITANPVYRPQMRPALLDLPSVSLTTARAINGNSEVKASMEWLRPDGLPGFQEPCGVRLFGGAFTDFAKKSFRLYFRSEYGASKLRYPLFEGQDGGVTAVQEFDGLELRSGSHDMQQRGFYLSNIFTDDTLLEMGRLNPHGRFVHLYLNGVYWGMYHLRERWGAAMHQSYLGGSRTNYESINGNWNVGGWADPGTPYDGDGSTWTRIKSLRNRYEAVRPWLDVAQYVDYMLMWMFGGSEDEYRCVGPNVPGSGFQFYLNDADGWFCIPAYCAAGDRTARSAPGKSPGDGPGSLFSMLYKEGNPEYRLLLGDEIHRTLFNDGALTPARNAARLTNRTADIARAFVAESARWNYLTPTEWAGRRDSALNSWLPRRTAEAIGQFRAAGFYPTLDAPTQSPGAGTVAAGTPLRFLGPPGASVYYTLDGADPRLPGGAVSPSARSTIPGGATEILVPAGSRWRWFTDATGLSSSEVVVGQSQWSPSDWKHPGFTDAGWKEGPAQLGYGEGDEVTVIPFGGNALQKWITSYFRHRFTLPDLGKLTRVVVRLRRDDGAIVYLNGRPAVRDSMPSGTVTASTLATSASDDGAGFQEFNIPLTLLVTGENVLAVELHQTSGSTTDASFDLELAAETTGGGSTGDAPILDRNTVVKSRARSGTQWSALNVAYFQVGEHAIAPGSVRITEINCQPLLGTGDTEFLELANLSAEAANLRGVRFVNGIAFRFSDKMDTLLAPGQRLVLVSDVFDFRQRHGIDVPIAGRYAGQLADAGERILMESPDGLPLLDLTYGTAPPWPAGVSGGGYSLVLAHPGLNPDSSQAWRASITTNGTPGGTDATVFTGTPDADVDGDGLPSLLEYALGTRDDDPDSGPGSLRGTVSGSGDFSLSITRNLAADDIRLQVEASPDLRSWSSARWLASENVLPGLIRETWGTPATGASQAFLRIRVVRP